MNFSDSCPKDKLFLINKINKKTDVKKIIELSQLRVGNSSSLMIGFYLYLFYFYFSSYFLPLISGFFTASSSSSLLSTAFLMKIPGGLSSEYFSPLKFRLFCSLSFRILAIPVFKSDCKSATLNSQFLLKFEAICSRSLTGIFYINDRWISF